jgi:hypothetical protein
MNIPFGQTTAAIPPAVANPTPAQTAPPTLPTTAAEDAGFGNSSIAAMNAVFADLIPKSTTTMEDVQRAMTPTMQRQQMGLPASMTRPIAPFQAAPMDQRQVVGAGNARARGIGNAITGAMNTVGSFVNARAQQLQDQHAQSVSRFLQAQAGADQASEELKGMKPGDPGYDDVKKTVDQNQALQKKMLSDDKFRKVLEKGMNVSLTDPSKNKTPEHQSVFQGFNIFKHKQAQAGQQPSDVEAMLKRFGEQMPTQLGPNQAAIRQLQMKQQYDAAQNAMAKERLEYAKAQMETEGKLDVAKWNALKAFQLAEFNASKSMEQIAARGDIEIKVENLRKTNDLLLKEAELRMDMKDPLKQQQLVGNLVKGYADITGTLEAQRRDYIDKIDKLLKTGTKDQGLLQEYRTGMDNVITAERDNMAMWNANKIQIQKEFGIQMPSIPMPPVPKVGEGEEEKGAPIAPSKPSTPSGAIAGSIGGFSGGGFQSSPTNSTNQPVDPAVQQFVGWWNSPR